jgi:hypothetical protein
VEFLSGTLTFLFTDLEGSIVLRGREPGRCELRWRDMMNCCGTQYVRTTGTR